MSRLLEEHPDCEVRLSEEEPEDPRIGDLDMLFYDGVVDDDVESVKLLDDPYVLVARTGDFSEDPVRLADLDGRDMVAWPATCDQPRMEQAMGAAAPTRGSCSGARATRRCSRWCASVSASRSCRSSP